MSILAAPRNSARNSYANIFIAVSDLSVSIAAPFLAHWIRDQFGLATADTSGRSFVVYALASALMSLVLLVATGSTRATWKFFALPDACRASQAIALGIGIGCLIGFAHDRLDSVARAIPFLQAAVQIMAFVGIRLLCQRIADADKAPVSKAKQVLVVGCSKTAVAYMDAVRELSGASIDIVGFLALDRHLVGQTVRGKRILGTIGDAAEVISTLQVHGIEIWRLAVAIKEERFSSSEILALADADKLVALPRIDVHTALSQLAPIDDEPIAFLAPNQSSWDPLYVATKRAIDVVGSATLLAIAAPVMLVLCAVVAIDVGFPILFWQRRLGKDGEYLTVYKFRTMRSAFDAAGCRIPDTRRVSFIGRWMRKLRLDELPQLYSILRGDMSFVGPRPLLPIDQPTDAKRRLTVKPGLTGWAQVHGGNLVAIEDKNALDLWYVAHSCLRLDIEIVIRTVIMLLQGDNLDRRKIEQAKRWMSGLAT